VPFIFTGITAGGTAAAGTALLGGLAATGIGLGVLALGAGITIAIKATWDREKTCLKIAKKLSK